MKKFLLICIFLIVSLYSFGQFGEKQVLNHAMGGIYEIIPIDYDNDNDNDLIVSTINGSKVVFYENIGNDSLNIQKVICTTAHMNIDTGDINLDGLTDLIIGNNLGVGWYENSGTNNFSNYHLVYSSNDLCFGTAADIDNDGDFDIVAGFYNTSKISWFTNDGLGNFGSEQIITNSATDVNTIQVEDMDNDGFKDLVVTSAMDYAIDFYHNNGSLVFTCSNLYPANNTIPVNNAPQLIDINSDGLKDILFHLWSTLQITNLGGGNFNTAGFYSTNAMGYVLDFNDYDNNGSLNAVYGAGIFAGYVEIVTTSQIFFMNDDNIFSTDIFFTDFNNDGYLDIIEGRISGRIFWYENDGANYFLNPVPLNNKCYSPLRIYAEDYDFDGDQDILAAYTYDRFLALYENQGGGVFASEQVIIDTLINYVVSDKTSLNDLDNDNDLDFVYRGDDQLIILKNNSGIWDTTTIDTTNIRSICIEDMDLDGFKDIVFSNFNNTYLLINDGTGNFPIAQLLDTLSSYDYYDFINAIDMDNDLDMDLVVATSSGEVYWTANNGSCQFDTIHLVFNTGSNFFGLLTKDLDNDGDMDIIPFSGHDIFWVKNDGNFNFSSSVIFSDWTDFVHSIDIADLDNDTDMDIVFTYNSIVYWIENENGVYLSPIIAEGNSIQPVPVVTGDFDMDGFIDIAFGTDGSNEVAWIKNYVNCPYKIMGEIFYDANQNGIRDTLEAGFLNSNIQISPGSLASYTNQYGEYWKAVSVGNYTVDYTPLNYWGITTAYQNYNVDITINQQIVDTCDFGFYPDSVVTDIATDLIFDHGMCGYYGQFWIHYRNIGTNHDKGIIELKLDTMTDFYYSTFTPDSIINEYVYWHFDSLDYFEEKTFYVYTSWPITTSMNDTIVEVLNLYVLDSIGNNTYTSIDTTLIEVTCSYDPNDKRVEPVGYSVEHHVSNNQRLTYTIRFQNTGNATAIDVEIIDTLDQNLNLSTFELVASSHSVRTTIDNYILKFEFDSIMLPDSTANEMESHGFVRYSIIPDSGLVPNTTILNKAEIYFDYNPAIITNTVFNNIECWISPPVPIIEYSTGNLIVNTTNNIQWYINDTIINGENNTSINPLWTGSYMVEVINQYNCGTFSDTYDYVVNIDEFNNNNFVLYPNPTSGILYFKNIKNAQITITDLTGRIVIRKNNVNKSIDINLLKTGLYIVRIKQAENFVTTKIIKTH